jgi:hypothetical protein
LKQKHTVTIHLHWACDFVSEIDACIRCNNIVSFFSAVQYSILWIWDVWIISRFWLLWIKSLWVSLDMYFIAQIYKFLLEIIWMSNSLRDPSIFFLSGWASLQKSLLLHTLGQSWDCRVFLLNFLALSFIFHFSSSVGM